ncbi:hypothetical protein ES288_A11G325300v1 [Gossypium darwinii]|uniref:Reverse transcriptase zinc-binding domain-containing protein n=1 Tax=Gossypium darwinii TaxID=34276 RepID=A0A5D2ER46_GOSDA|nr:hypothetical protein ES288_A11G325300v1 [Gossypium darwinii]
MDSFYWQIGNGRTTLFWMDIWFGNRPLKQDFPRLFLLARQKKSSVADFLRNPEFYKDEWNELVTRFLLGMVEVMLSRLVERVSSTVLVPDVDDKLCWVIDRNGEFLENFWWICLNRCRIDSIKSKPTALIWCPPPHGWLKFNVCGIVKEDRAGCGGALRDKEGVARALFSSFAATNDADLAEIGTVKVALEVFLAMN